MLVLTRRRDETIVISKEGEFEITVTIVDLRGDKVKLGIDAPDDIRVDRLEVHDRIVRDRRAEGTEPRYRP